MASQTLRQDLNKLPGLEIINPDGGKKIIKQSLFTQILPVLLLHRILVYFLLPWR